MKITQARLKEIIKEVIDEARLPDTMGAGYGDPQDDEREDAMGPRVPHEFQLTGKWEKDLGILIRHTEEYLKSAGAYGRQGRHLEEPLHMIKGLLTSMQGDLGRDLPVRRHGQSEPIDPTKYVEAPTEMEQQQVMKAFHLVDDAFTNVARGKLIDPIQLKKDIRSAWPSGQRQYWSAKGGKSKQGGGYEYDPTRDTPTYFESLQKIIDEELEAVLSEKDLSADERRDLPDSDFALPGKGEGPKGKQAGSYPVPDEKHARSALSLVAQHGTPEEKAKVRAAVKRKFPSIDQRKE